MSVFNGTITSFNNVVSQWGGALAARLAAHGWVQTSDTGQVNIGAAASSSTVNYNYGYQIWRMNDSLQATNPVFIKIEFLTGATYTNPALYLTVGTGSNGTGTLTGIVSPKLNPQCASYSSSTVSYLTTGDVNRFACFMPNNIGNGLGFSIERSKDSSGNDTGDGVQIFIFGSLATSQQYYLALNGTYRSTINNISALYPTGATTLIHDSNVVPVLPLISHNQDGIKNPGTNLVLYAGGDIAPGTQFTVAVYGTVHTYWALGTSTGTSGGPYTTTLVPGSPATALAVRYE